MTTDPAYDAAVEIAHQAVDGGYGPRDRAEDIVAALARAGWLHDPGEVERLRAVAAQVEEIRDDLTGGTGLFSGVVLRLTRALDAVPTAETTSGEQDLQFHCTHSTHEVAPLRCGGRHYGLPCGPGCAPVVS